MRTKALNRMRADRESQDQGCSAMVIKNHIRWRSQGSRANMVMVALATFTSGTFQAHAWKPSEHSPRTWRHAGEAGWEVGEAAFATESCASMLQLISPDGMAAVELRDIQNPLIVKGVAHSLTEEDQWTRTAIVKRLGGQHVGLYDPILTAAFGPGVAGGASPLLSDYLSQILNGSQPNELFTNSNMDPIFTKTVFESITTPSWDVLEAKPAHHGEVFSLGPEKSGLAMHSHGLAWLAQLHGRKRFHLLPPKADLNAISSEAYQQGFFQSPSAWSEATLAGFSAVPGSFSCALMPGDLIVVPPFWYHATENLDEAVAVGGQHFGYALQESWTEADELARFGELDGIPQLYENMGNARAQFASFFKEEGDAKKSRDSKVAALKHLRSAVKLHPLKLSARKALSKYGASWARSKTSHALAAEELRDTLRKLNECLRLEILDKKSYVEVAKEMLLTYRSAYNGARFKSMGLSVDELWDIVDGLANLFDGDRRAFTASFGFHTKQGL